MTTPDILEELKTMADQLDDANSDEPDPLGMLLVRTIGEIRKLRGSSSGLVMDSPIKSGWRGHLNGFVEKTDSHVQVSEITLRLDRRTTYALANMLCDSKINEDHGMAPDQKEALSNLGAAIGRLIDHWAANNGGRICVKP